MPVLDFSGPASCWRPSFPSPCSLRGRTVFASATASGDEVLYRPRGVNIYAEALDPTIGRWYLPASMFGERGRRQWEYTNYASDIYQRYVNSTQEGTYFYDQYGDLITRGWLIYDWRQTQRPYRAVPW